MPLSFRIALRFLFRSRSDRPLTLFTAICVFGVVLSVTLFLLIDTVMNGFALRLRENLIGFDAPVTIETSPGDFTSTETALGDFARSQPEFLLTVRAAREFYAFLKIGELRPSGVKVRVVDESLFAPGAGGLEVHWEEGFDAATFVTHPNAVLLGKDLYRGNALQYRPGEILNLIHPFADLGPSGELEPQARDVVVAGTFTTGTYEIDNFYLFLPRVALAGFANESLMESYFHLFPKTVLDAEKLKTRLLTVHPEWEGEIKTWLDKNRTLFRAMRLERIVFTILFVLLVVISCLNLASLIRIFGLAKLKDAAVLRSLGASLSTLRGIFWGIGLILGGVGGVLGVTLGCTLVFIAQNAGFRLPAAYEFTELPLRLSAVTVVALLLGAPLVSIAVAWWPARQCVNRTVTDVMRIS